MANPSINQEVAASCGCKRIRALAQASVVADTLPPLDTCAPQGHRRNQLN